MQLQKQHLAGCVPHIIGMLNFPLAVDIAQLPADAGHQDLG